MIKLQNTLLHNTKELIILDTSSVIQFMILVFLLFLSAFFSSAETAITTVNKVKIKALAEHGSKRAQLLERIIQNPSKMLSTVLIGNNIVNISATSLATTLIIHIWGNYAIGIATGILTILILLFGEIVPKTWASIYAENIALLYCYPIYGLMFFLTPLIYLVGVLSNAILRILGIDPHKKANSMTEHELKTYVAVSHEDGVIESEEREMILNVFDFGDSFARDIMIPRIDMTMADLHSSYEEILFLFQSTLYSRIPIFEEDTDNIVGIITLKDFFMVTDKTNFQIKNILRAPYYTYESKKTSDLLVEMREKSQNLAIVINEYGASVGLITMEDLLEEIVGEIRDEYDQEEDELLKEIEPFVYLVEASMKLDDINDALDTNIRSNDYDSIGGIMIEELNRLPHINEEIFIENNIRLIATERSANRIKKITLILPDTRDFSHETLDEDNLYSTKTEEEIEVTL